MKIGGLIVARQHPPTAKGFAFLAVEDPTGMVNVVVAPAIYERDRQALHGAFVLIEGVLAERTRGDQRSRKESDGRVMGVNDLQVISLQ